jgi:hypothetical protein
LSAAPDWQSVQAPPWAPQYRSETVSQVFPEQHPLGQLGGLHPPQAPFMQFWGWQSTQAVPAFPQAFFWLPGRQLVPKQHPAQLAPSHTQAPPTQCCPGAHGALAPQRQTPAPEQPSAVRSHAVQAPALVPQVPNDRGLQVAPEQQPSAQEAGVQAQAPLVQTWPAAHMELPPQVHWPPTEQPSALASQTVQATPPVPQLDSERIWQEPPEQQPEGHEVASHAQTPLTQCCPVAQGGPLPHWQVPLGQRSARMAPQGEQAWPAGAQALALQATQVGPEQQPAAQLDESHPLHTPAAQVPGVQLWQVPPPVPQAESSPPGRQVEPEQQPLQDNESHTQTLPEHLWPGPQGAALPQRQAPPAEQVSAFCGSQETQVSPPTPQLDSERVWQVLFTQQPAAHEVAPHTQAPAEQRWPFSQAGSPPQAQVPAAEQPSATAGSQETHAAPSVPQLVADAARQLFPEQHPEGHEVASQTQAPPEQRWPGPHAAAPPQAHDPVEEQPSAMSGSHEMQLAPVAPQASSVGGEVQVLPEQHPLAQVAVQSLHPPEAQVAGAVHDWHGGPPLPQALSARPLRQVVPSQQPWQESGSHTQLPPEQRCPSSQAKPPPHWQLPDDEQPSAFSGSQMPQIAPPVPQLDDDEDRHVPAAQHPLGHEVASQRQLPPEQRWP